jgi:hypothetical protein
MTEKCRVCARLTPRCAGSAIAAARVAIGVGALRAPGPLLAVWVGKDLSERRAARVMGRALAGRDLVLGGLALFALHRGQQPGAARVAVGAGAVADGVDLLATLIAWRELPRWTRYLVLLATLGASAGGVWAATG